MLKQNIEIPRNIWEYLGTFLNPKEYLKISPNIQQCYGICKTFADKKHAIIVSPIYGTSINCKNLDLRIFVVWKALKKEALNFPVQETLAICGNTLKKDALKKEALKKRGIEFPC